jgi:hypothetical protein
VSATNRGHGRPGTGAASRKCQPATGDTMPTMNRGRTRVAVARDWTSPRSTRPRWTPRYQTGTQTGADDFERVTGIEPA